MGLESDSSVVIGLINTYRVIMDKNYNLIMQIKNMLGKTWEVKTLHVYRDVNCVTDWLANYELTKDMLDKESNVLAEPPCPS